MATSKKTFVLIPVDEFEPMREIAPEKGEQEYKFLQRHVEGYIEHGDRELWVNEEGLLKGMRLNYRASRIAGRHLVGPAVAHGRLAKRLIKIGSVMGQVRKEAASILGIPESEVK